MSKRKQKSNRQRNYARSLEDTFELRNIICSSCGEYGKHYVPPSLGEEGFFICEVQMARKKDNDIVGTPTTSKNIPRDSGGEIIDVGGDIDGAIATTRDSGDSKDPIPELDSKGNNRFGRKDIVSSE